MRNAIVGILFLAAGCASLPVASIQNPVTPEMLFAAENGATVAFAGLNAYRSSCVKKIIPQTCREVVQSIQVYTRKLSPLLDTLRVYVRENDQVNAFIVYTAVKDALGELKAIAQANNLTMGGV